MPKLSSLSLAFATKTRPGFYCSFLDLFFCLAFLPPPNLLSPSLLATSSHLLCVIWDEPFMAKERDSGEVPVVPVLGDIDSLSAPFTYYQNQLRRDLP